MAFTVDPFVPDDGRAESILSMETVKAHVSVAQDVTEFDGLLELFRDAAIAAVEQRTGLLLAVTAGLVWRGDFPLENGGSRIMLARGPLVSVESVDYLDRDGVAQLVDAADFVPHPGSSWIFPVTRWPSSWRTGSVEIGFTAGFDMATRPRPLVQAALLLVAHYFLNREAVVSGAAVAELPLGVADICDRYRAVTV